MTVSTPSSEVESVSSSFSDRMMSVWHQIQQAVSTVWHGFADAIASFWHSFLTQSSYLWTRLSILAINITAPLASADLWQLVLYWFLLLLSLAGVAGALVPALPGVILILASVVIWGLVKGFVGLTWALGVAIAAFILSVTVDYLAGIIGAQRVGASQWGQTGAIVGMVLGFFGLLPALPVGGPILGILFGTVIGAFVGEFLHRRELELLPRVKQSFRVGIAIVVGTVVGNILQGVLAFFAFVVFLFTSWSSVYGG
ncbi:MAG: DUF456 family protein [Elainellaceae cyanobacterium]